MGQPDVLDSSLYSPILGPLIVNVIVNHPWDYSGIGKGIWCQKSCGRSKQKYTQPFLKSPRHASE